MNASYKPHPDFTPTRPVTKEELDQILDTPVLHLEKLKEPIIITSIELLFNNGMYFVRTRTKDDLTGIAPANDRAAWCYPILNELVAPYFIGKDARDLEKLLEGVYVYRSNYKLAGLPFWCSVAFVELSILDILGKALGVPVGQLFGPRIREKVNIYVASGNRGTTPEEELDILARWVDETKAKAIKFKIGGRMSKNADSIAGRSEGLIYLTRKYFGDQMIIHADGNGSYDAQEAIRYGKILEEIGAYFYEEPCPFDDLWETRKTAQALTIPLAFGEQETSLRRFEWIIEKDAARVVQPDILYHGGLIRTVKVAKMAELAGKTITPHVSGGFCFVYVLHLASFTPNLGSYQEHKRGIPESNALLGDILRLQDGTINIPNTPGLGIDPANPILKHALLIR